MHLVGSHGSCAIENGEACRQNAARPHAETFGRRVVAPIYNECQQAPRCCVANGRLSEHRPAHYTDPKFSLCLERPQWVESVLSVPGQVG
jgi:hypothetical protein